MKVKTLKPGNNFTIGRGEVSINGRYVGNTPKFDLRVSKKGKLQVEFHCDDMSAENLHMFFELDSAQVSFKAHNAVGPNIDITIPHIKFKREWALKTADEWMNLRFIGEAIPVDGTLLEFTYPTTCRVTR